jgi:predicted dehydrogenase
VAETSNDRLMVDFNRRFAPLLTQRKSQSGPACCTAMTRYLVSAGPLSANSWYGHDAAGGASGEQLDNYRKATVRTGRGHRTTRAGGGHTGQRAEIATFAEACLSGAGMPISLETLVAETKASFAVRESLSSCKSEQE